MYANFFLKYASSTTNCFCGIFVVIPQHQKFHIIYIPIICKIVSLHDIVFDEKVYGTLSYTSRPYSEALTVQPEVSYIPYATSSHEKNGDIIIFAQFEEGNLLENELNTEEDTSFSDSIYH